MKLLVDNQLPLQLALHLRTWGLDAVHVLEVGLNDTEDEQIWIFATSHGRIVVSKDEDFVFLASRANDAGRLIWVRLGNCRDAALMAAFDRSRDALIETIADGQRIIELR